MAQTIPEEMFQARCRAAETQLVRGTFNVSPRDVALNDAVESLRYCDFETDQDNVKLGPLQWWSITIAREGYEALKCFLVRHPRTRTQYLELMASVKLREALNAEDGAVVTIRR